MKSQKLIKFLVIFAVILVLGIGSFALFRRRIINIPYLNKFFESNREELLEGYNDDLSKDVTGTYESGNSEPLNTGDDLDESVEPTDIPSTISYSISLPLAAVDFYEGKYENAVAGLNSFMLTHSTLFPGTQVSLIRDKVLWFTAENGYVNTSKGFAFGVCWFVTALGGLIDKANTDWNSQFGWDLFVVTESHGHGITYPTYFPNNGYGYAVYQATDGSILDYTFSINPAVTNVQAVDFTFWGETNSATGYNGLSIEGNITLTIK